MSNINPNTALSVSFGAIVLLLFCIIILVRVYNKRLQHFQQIAASDPVTRGPTPAEFYRDAAKQPRNQHDSYAVITMEIQNYRPICRTFGKNNGDRVLVHLYKILKSTLSESEPIARVNNSTFCFLLKNRQEDVIRARLKQIYESANCFNQQRQNPYMLDLCFGCYIPSDHTEALDDMLEKSQQALERRKDETRYHFYKESFQDSVLRKEELIGQVDLSIKNRDFIIYLQPKVRLGDSRIVGAEALIRWRHPQRGMLTPEMFVPLLEEYHMIHQLDEYIFERVCQKVAEWKQAGWKPCPISVNLSRENLEVDNFLEDYSKLCQRYSVEPELIEFELSETILLENPQKIRAIIEEIHSYGFQCSLDNFGRSFIPLHLLRELNIDTIKLDRSFFYGENNSRRNRFIVEAILKLASQMHIRTIAEGIDNASQVQYLKQAACDMIQGFYYFRPMSIDEFQNAAYLDGELRYVEPEGAHSGSLIPPRHAQDSSNVVMFSYLPEEDRILFSNSFSPVLEGQLGISNASALFRRSDLIHENDRADFLHMLKRCRNEAGWVENTLRFYTAEGRYEWLEIHLHREQLPSSSEAVISGTLINMVGWKNEVDRWKEKANRDALTGLYNREYFEHFTRSTLESGNLITAAVVFVDIDDFKHVNDTLGHSFGDDVLCCVAKRILGVFRHTDIVARYGGDEFVVFVNGIGRADLQKRLTQLCGVFRYPYRNNTIEYQISGSIGAAMFPEDGNSYQELLNHADCALYTAKRQGKDQFVLYQPELEDSSPAEKK